jgi:hypothetical protein|tara:strand:+ start:64 stop:357 length:294 start_codon:yes stop_codon:yes gene_type:complete
MVVWFAHVRVGHRQALNTKTPDSVAAGGFFISGLGKMKVCRKNPKAFSLSQANPIAEHAGLLLANPFNPVPCDIAQRLHVLTATGVIGQELDLGPAG